MRWRTLDWHEVQKDVFSLKTKLNICIANKQPGHTSFQHNLLPDSDVFTNNEATDKPKNPKNIEADDSVITVEDGKSEILGDFDFDANDSVTTVDENIPELSDEKSLNSYVPTTQLMKLRQ